jgi:hypothetical protein
MISSACRLLIILSIVLLFSSLIPRPLELAYKYGNLSEGACKQGYAAAKMTTIYPT